jgi:hypothetical protein
MRLPGENQPFNEFVSERTGLARKKFLTTKDTKDTKAASRQANSRRRRQ